MIDLTRPVWFYDDRSKSDGLLRMTEILWQDKDHVLCRACVISFPAFKPEDLDPKNLMLLEAVKVDEPILFHQETGDVANQDFDSWIATDEITWWRPFGCFAMIRHTR